MRTFRGGSWCCRRHRPIPRNTLIPLEGDCERNENRPLKALMPHREKPQVAEGTQQFTQISHKIPQFNHFFPKVKKGIILKSTSRNQCKPESDLDPQQKKQEGDPSPRSPRARWAACSRSWAGTAPRERRERTAAQPQLHRAQIGTRGSLSKLGIPRREDDSEGI